MSSALTVTTHVHLDDDTRIKADTLDTGGMTIGTIDIGDINDMTIFVSSRGQAERLFDAVAEVAMAWRERDPDGATLDAVVSD